MVQVGIRKTRLENLERDVEELLELIGYVPSKAKILLKPNIVVASPPEEGDITHPRVIEGLVRYFRKSKKEVVVAEGTGIFGADEEFEKLLQTTQYDVLRDELNVPIINL